MDLRLCDRVYVVTGGSRGLGFAAAQALLAEGARVVLSGPHETSAAAAGSRLARGVSADDKSRWVVADNADTATPDRLLATAEDRFGRLDGAVVSVGGTPPGTVVDTPDQVWRSAFESVFLGAVRLARVLGTYLAGDGSGVAATGSLAGTGGSLVFVLASSVRVPLAELAVEVDALRGDPDEVRARKSEDIPLRRYGEPAEFGRVAAFLVSRLPLTSLAR